MARRATNRLSARTVVTVKPGKHADGLGLYLIVAPEGARKWVFRYTRNGRAREMGLGQARADNLAEARRRTIAARQAIEAGQDPLDMKRRVSKAGTFGAVAEDLMASLDGGFRNAKHKAQWRSTLTTYAAPLWEKPVSTIGVDDVLAVLKPIWQTKPETATRVRGRIERVLDAAKAKKLREGDNPAAWRGNLAALLPKAAKLARGHHAAMPYAEVPAFIAELRQREAVTARALEFLILTAARAGEVFGATWAEIDTDTKVWIVPKERMKAGRPHSVPLTPRALAIIEEMRQARVEGFEHVFPGAEGGLDRKSTRLNSSHT